jgi:hypothetical protein
MELIDHLAVANPQQNYYPRLMLIAAPELTDHR